MGCCFIREHDDHGSSLFISKEMAAVQDNLSTKTSVSYRAPFKDEFANEIYAYFQDSLFFRDWETKKQVVSVMCNISIKKVTIYTGIQVQSGSKTDQCQYESTESVQEAYLSASI